MELLNHINRSMKVNWYNDPEIIVHIVEHELCIYNYNNHETRKASDYIFTIMKKLMSDNNYSVNNLYQMASDIHALYKAGVPAYSFRT